MVSLWLVKRNGVRRAAVYSPRVSLPLCSSPVRFRVLQEQTRRCGTLLAGKGTAERAPRPDTPGLPCSL